MKLPLDLAPKDLHHIGLAQVRAAVRFALVGRDGRAPALAEVRELELALHGRTLRTRLYAPEDLADPAPLMIYFHGGGFVLGDIDTHDALCRRLADAGRFKVLSVDYRLAPEHAYPAQIEDAFDAADWTFANAEALGAEPGRIAIGGDSAGGYLTVASTLHRPGRFKAQMLLYPLLQLDDAAWADSLLKDARVIGRLTVRYIAAQLADAGAGVPSLRQAAPPTAPPTFIVTGGALDPVRPDALAYAEALRAAGAPCVVREYNQLHSFMNLTHVLDAACQAIADVGALAGEAMRRP